MILILLEKTLKYVTILQTYHNETVVLVRLSNSEKVLQYMLSDNSFTARAYSRYIHNIILIMYLHSYM